MNRFVDYVFNFWNRYLSSYTYRYYLDNPIVMGLSAENVFMSPGDEIRIYFGLRHPSVVNWAGIDSQYAIALTYKESLDGAFSIFQVNPTTNASFGNEDIDMNSIASDMKLKDLFMNVVKAFNLVVKDNPNKPNDLIIEPRDDFFKSKQKVKEWTQILIKKKSHIKNHYH